jgi:hypothetical protein
MTLPGALLPCRSLIAVRVRGQGLGTDIGCRGGHSDTAGGAPLTGGQFTTVTPPVGAVTLSPLHRARLLLAHLGLLAADVHHAHVALLHRTSPKLHRDLKALDKQHGSVDGPCVVYSRAVCAQTGRDGRPGASKSSWQWFMWHGARSASRGFWPMPLARPTMRPLSARSAGRCVRWHSWVGVRPA